MSSFQPNEFIITYLLTYFKVMTFNRMIGQLTQLSFIFQACFLYLCNPFPTLTNSLHLAASVELSSISKIEFGWTYACTTAYGVEFFHNAVLNEYNGINEDLPSEEQFCDPDQCEDVLKIIVLVMDGDVWKNRSVTITADSMP